MTAFTIDFGATEPDDTTRARTALADLNAKRQTLYENDRPVYAPEVHAQKESALLAEFNTQLAAIVTEADRTATEAQGKLATLQYADATYRMTPEELATVRGRQDFIREDASRLPLRELVDQMRRALAVGDKAALYLYARYVPERLAALRPTPALGSLDNAPDYRSTIPVTELAMANAAGVALEDINRELVPKETRERITAHEEAIARAEQFRETALRLQRVADGTDARVRRAIAAEYAVAF